MTISDFFFSPRGRISRQEYWLGMIALMALTMMGVAVVDPNGFSREGGQVRPPSFESTVWSLVFAWPSTAVSIKRFNDREWPEWVGYALGAAMVAFVVANYFGYMLDSDRMSVPEKLVMVTAAVAFLWALVENGFQRGTDGPNRYGPDPVARAGE